MMVGWKKSEQFTSRTKTLSTEVVTVTKKVGKDVTSEVKREVAASADEVKKVVGISGVDEAESEKVSWGKLVLSHV